MIVGKAKIVGSVDQNSTVSLPIHTESPELPLLERGHHSIRPGREEEQGKTPGIKLRL